jgi:CheY-like chemotaxis protein/anti-sigma regulatory factor (Ser/Thr protein kinase)
MCPIVADVLHLRLFGGVIRPVRKRIDILQILQEVLDMKVDWFRAHDMGLAASIGRGNVMVDGDRNQLEQVFTNIITNAQEAMADSSGGKALSIEALEEGDTVRISFSDVGPGIASEHLGRVFDPFFTTKEIGEGKGLGLSMCHRIVQEHMGSIRMESVLGEGTTVVVELPVAQQAPEDSVGDREADSSPDGAGLRILVVDDEPAIAGFLSRALSDQGHVVDLAASGLEVVGRTDLDIYDLLLLDMKMPGIGGAELFENLRQLPGDIISRVVFVTGDTASITTQEFIERTGNPVLAKPFTLEQLTETVSRYEARSRESNGT